MKVLYKYCLIIASVFLFFSCEKETEDISRITYFCDLELLGSSEVVLAKGTAFVDPGYKATEGDNDVTDQVTVSSLDVNTPGSYTLTYSVKNKDGFAKTATRKVYVYDNTPTPIEPGSYHVDASSSRSALGGTAGSPATEFKKEPAMAVFQIAPGQFFISDLFGGYYDIGRGYGIAYAVSGVLGFDGTNFSLKSSNATPWGDKHSAVRGTYAAETKTLVLEVDYATFTFHLNIVKN